MEEEKEEEGLTTITGAFIGAITSKTAIWIYSIIAAVFVILVGIIQMGGIYGIRRKLGRRYRPKADYF